MPIINPTLPADGDNAVVEPYNAAITAILGVLNGGIDDSNISAVNGSKIAAGSVPITAMNAAANKGWIPLVSPPNSISVLGQHSYNMVFNSADLTAILSIGARLQAIRSATAPVQCANLNGTTQFFSNSSPSGLTFTNNFSEAAHIKLKAYSASTQVIASRFNGTSGWLFGIDPGGRVILEGLNAGAINFRYVLSQQSVPLNKWVRVAAWLDMAGFTTATCGVSIDDVSVPIVLTSNGSNPTALIQAGNLEIGSTNGGTLPFNGEITQLEIFNAIISPSTLSSYGGQTITGSETNVVGAWTLSNSLVDLSPSNNALTANGSATTTTADSPFAQGVAAGTTEYGIVTGIVFSTNTTVTVQVPEGSMLPTSGSLSALSYATVKIPFGFPVQRNKWRISSILSVTNAVASNATYSSFLSGGWSLNVPTGSWEVGWAAQVYSTTTVAVYWDVSAVPLTGLTAAQGYLISPLTHIALSSTGTTTNTIRKTTPINVSSSSSFVMYTLGATTGSGIDANTIHEIFAELAYL